MKVLGIDIGGTKCALTIAEIKGETVEFVHKEAFATKDFKTTLNEIIVRSKAMTDKYEHIEAAGISCGGPLDSKRGVIMSPPNLPGWDDVHIVDQIRQHYDAPVKLQNDANACAVAEWKFGAGKGMRNMVFLTFGTGLGAGLILDGKLYCGTNDNAGEVGHIRLERFGPVGYGKSGSFEGFCSGGGIAQLGYSMALEKAQTGVCPLYYKKGMSQKDITAKTIADAARLGDETALKVYRTCGTYLGKGLSIIIDLLNPELIVFGSVFSRSKVLLWETTIKEIEMEALQQSASCCQVVPAALGEQIGDYAAIAVALS